VKENSLLLAPGIIKRLIKLFLLMLVVPYSRLWTNYSINIFLSGDVMITKTKLWNIISEELKNQRRLDIVTKSVMEKIKKLDIKDVKNPNK
tara:strand:+ start:63 stop:335 length:273 start_codon:yes stop_codon:yes gene_type:complete